MERTNYAEAVAAILKHAGRTAYELAKTAGLTQQAILDVAKGKRPNPRADTLDRLLRAAGLDWSFLNQFRASEADTEPDAEPKRRSPGKKPAPAKGKR